LFLHEHSADSALSQSLYGLSPDRVDWEKREVSEIKKSRSHEAALINQLLFYVAALSVATGQTWKGVLRYTASRRTKPVVLDEAAVRRLRDSLARLRAVLSLPRPPAKEEKSVCKGCSYALLCWGRSTDDEDA
jgi:CRISPR-associated exonuclease Cas4